MVEHLTAEEIQRLEALDPDQRAFVMAREPLWRRAHEIAAKNAGMDASDVFHVLATWHETPTDRLKRALRRGRLLARTR